MCGMDGQAHRNPRDIIQEEVRSSFLSLTVLGGQRSRASDLQHTQPWQRSTDTSQLRWRDPGATKKTCCSLPSLECVSFHFSLFASVTILKVGSWLFFLPSRQVLPAQCRATNNTHKLPVALEAREHHTWVTVTLAGCHQLHKAGQGRFDMPKTNLFLSLSLLATKTTSWLRLSTFRKFSPRLKTPLRDFPDPSKVLAMATPCVLLHSHQWVI